MSDARVCYGRRVAFIGESKLGRLVDALAHGGDEGRGKLRKARVRCKRPLTPGFPNGTTQLPEGQLSILCVWRQTEGTETS